MLKINPEVFHEDAIDPATRALNDEIIAKMKAAPDPWSLDVSVVREGRRNGRGIFPLEPFVDDAMMFEIEGPGGPLPLRAINPDNSEPKGVFLHFHGGGWRVGNYDLHDQRLKRLANACNLTCISVEYRLSPESPYPAAQDDCEAAALWLCDPSNHSYNVEWLAIGGESAGAHLSVTTLLRLRDKHDRTPFNAALLIAGCYDLGGTSSSRNFGPDPLVMTNRDVENFVASYLPADIDPRDTDISPLYASLHDMPPAHFTVGTMDALLDDSLFMATRWIQHQPDTELEVFAGGCHVFHHFDDLPIAQTSQEQVERFLNRL